MPHGEAFRLEVLNERHPVRQFFCEEEELNDYLHNEALGDMQRSVARTFVEIDTSKPATENVAGFFTLRADAHRVKETVFADWLDTIGDEDKTAIIEIDVPLVELMWLARGVAWRGMGIGDLLMIDALQIVKSAADCVGVIGLHLRTTSQGKRLYRRYKVGTFKDYPVYDEDRYFLAIQTIRSIVERVQEL